MLFAVDVYPFGEAKYLLPFSCMIVGLFILLAAASVRRQGWARTVRLMGPMMVFAALLETMGTGRGGWYYPDYWLYVDLFGSYVPVVICMGWAVNLFLFYHMAEVIMSRLRWPMGLRRMAATSALTGAIGILLDMLEDPVAHVNHWWVWTHGRGGDTVHFYLVPVSNFLDWFFILSTSAMGFLLIEHSRFSEGKKLALSFLAVTPIAVSTLILHVLSMAVLPASFFPV